MGIFAQTTAFDIDLFWTMMASFLSPYYPFIGALFLIVIALLVLGWLVNLRN